MSVFFGTDGIRGVALSDITFDIAFKCGNSISQSLEKGSKVVVAKDTRVSGDMIVSAICAGLMCGGTNVHYVGVAPTGALAFLSQSFDFGIMITASHNPPEYNGIKIFCKGEKLQDSEEEKIERGFIKTKNVSPTDVGKLYYEKNLLKTYEKFLLKKGVPLHGMRIVLDCSNGASSIVAPRIFKKLGAKIYKTSCSLCGEKINCGCGSLHTEALAKLVKRKNADVGFAFDGDSDRLIAIDEKGNELDGDKILTGLATFFKARNQLSKNKVVGTSQTNMGVQKTLEKRGISLERADVGDKYVLEIMKKQNLLLGGEQSGHIIIKNCLPTGDGILSAVTLASCLKKSNMLASEFCQCEKYPQFNINIETKDKLRVLGSETLSNAILLVQQELAGNGRVLVRASGTEQKIRIMVESENESVSKNLASYLESVVYKIIQENGICAE